MEVVVIIKLKMVASSATVVVGEIVSFDLPESSNKSPEPLLDSTAMSQHMSALLPFFYFPLWENTMA